MYAKEYILKNNIVIHCKTQKEWNEVTKLFNIKWSAGTWSTYQENTCIRGGTSNFAGIDFYTSNRNTIISFEQFIESNSTEPLFLIFN